MTELFRAFRVYFISLFRVLVSGLVMFPNTDYSLMLQNCFDVAWGSPVIGWGGLFRCLCPQSYLVFSSYDSANLYSCTVVNLI